MQHWLVWKHEERDGKKTKVPYSALGGAGKTNDPATWSTFAEALAAYEKGNYDGLGFVFTDTPYIGIDIDGVINDNEAPREIGEIIGRFNSYTEISQSGTGFHVIVKGKLPEGRRRNGQYEMYGDGSPRYFAMTGNVGNTPLPIRECQNEINAFHAQYIADKPKPATHALKWDSEIGGSSDEESLKIGLNRDGFLRELHNGSRPNGNESSDDMAFLNKLAYWCNGNRELIKHTFINSPYFSQKDEAHKRKCDRRDYLDRTIDEALADLKATAAGDNKEYRQKSAGRDFAGLETSAPAEGKTSLVKASDVPYEPPRWLIAPYFQRGRGTLIQGNNGSGKTAMVCKIAAHISTGRPILGIPVQTPGNVLILSVEDDLPVLRGRIEASGGNLDKCHFMTNIAGVTFNSPEIEAAVKQLQAKLLIFDPFQAFIGAGVRMSESNQTRPELAKLFEMADRNDCAVAILGHTGKWSADMAAVNQSLGSVDIPAAMRSILHVIEDPDDETQHIVVQVKCSNAPRGKSIRYSIGDRGGVEWLGFSDMTAEDLSVIIKRKEKGIPYENEPLVKVFNQLITDRPGGGFWAYDELKSEGAKILGFPPFSTTNDLKYKLDSSLTKELQERDGLIVTHGHRSKSQRGIRIEQYQHPQGYQTTIPQERR